LPANTRHGFALARFGVAPGARLPRFLEMIPRLKA